MPSAFGLVYTQIPSIKLNLSFAQLYVVLFYIIFSAGGGCYSVSSGLHITCNEEGEKLNIFSKKKEVQRTSLDNCRGAGFCRDNYQQLLDTSI